MEVKYNLLYTPMYFYVLRSVAQKSLMTSKSIDQLGLNEIGMSLRSKFKYEHIKNVQTQANKQ